MVPHVTVPANNGVNLPVQPVTALANGASAAPVRPAGYAGRYPAGVGWLITMEK